MDKNIFETKNLVKLVCGAGNEDCLEVEKLVMLYSMAGCEMFDISADLDVLRAAKRGILKSGVGGNRYICVSVGIAGDPHTEKANITPETCIKCGKCASICLQSAIDNNLHINKKRCIGCGKCKKNCPAKSIYMTSEVKDLEEVLPPLIKEGIDCIEFHAISEDEAETFRVWDIINKLYDGMLSICVDRSKLGNEKLLQRVKEMLSCRKPYTTIIQADGAPMSGGVDDFKTTLQAVATAELFQDEDLPVYLLISGGTNSKTAQLAKQCGVYPDGISIGSFARKLVKKYLQTPNFTEDEGTFKSALDVAQKLVEDLKQ